MESTRATRLRQRIAALYADDAQVRDARPDEAISTALREQGLRLRDLVATVVDGYRDRPALAARSVQPAVDAATGASVARLLPEYTTMSYGELGLRLRAVAAAWQHDDETRLRPGEFVATLGFTSPDYAVVDLACVWAGAVAVPLQASASVTQLTAILAETTPAILATGLDTLPHAVDCVLAGATPRALHVFDFDPAVDAQRTVYEAACARLAGTGVRVRTLAEVEDRGRALPPAVIDDGHGDDRLALLIYTSGSTGTPKGAMYTERLVALMWLGQPQVAALTVNYLPLSHVAGRLALFGLLARGGTAYFTARADMSTLFEDLALARPTELFVVPRVCEMVLQRFQTERLRRQADDDRVKADLRLELFGDRLLSVVCGSAPLAPELKAFMESVLDLTLHDGYGSTEAGGSVVIDNTVRRPPVLDYRLADVPELGYFRTDKPHPRGELLLETTTMIPGYYRRPELNAQIFDEDGFYRTGDVVAELAPDRLVYVDRRNNVLKLAQGEFVTIARLEAIFANSPLVRQIFVYGNSERAYLLAVIVPSRQALAGDPATLKTRIAESLQHIGRDAELEAYEIPRDFLIETEPFTTESGLLSGIGKILRPAVEARYRDRLEQLYADLAAAQQDELVALRREAGQRPVLETVTRAAAAILGGTASDLSPAAHFTDLGGDSLAALALSNLLREIFAVEVPVGVITGPATDLRGLAAHIAAERENRTETPLFDRVHPDQTLIRATDLALEKFFDAEELAAAATAAPPVAEPRVVLLTGANGYLGRFLCLEWLERLDRVDGRLICLVRGADEAAALARLEAAFDSGDPELVRRFKELAQRRLTVVAGDIGEPGLGLAAATWRRLAAEVEHIVHPAALVNHVLPYRQLFGPNVAGTAEILRLALTERRKPIDFLSTVAVAAQIPVGRFVEDGDIRVISPTRTVDRGYANGYGNSKWAAEVLLRAAHDRFDLPVAVFRSDMILAHGSFAGQLNIPDVFTRLLLSLLVTGIAPASFHAATVTGERPRAHYDGLPADFTAAAITALGARTAGFHTYDVLNPHDDGISLDTFVDWLIEAGHPIERIPEHSEWVTRFETALHALPERQRKHSLLPLLHAYRRPVPALRGSALPAAEFRAAVRAAGITADGDIPHLTRALIEKYVADLRLHGLL
ncbi:thioester reductase domain-containing protein [Nocardia farcinica]|uniref:carboxylic acid reductase n=1 Tax=Nocardia farcinica TaxID=37329 RepID=UPI001894AFE6|nr:carboxylic acid reductase [Nocardia farcinica]MBF6445903.1 thioester reductase domain-containing protein [Nocardia farcinica]